MVVINGENMKNPETEHSQSNISRMKEVNENNKCSSNGNSADIDIYGDIDGANGNSLGGDDEGFRGDALGQLVSDTLMDDEENGNALSVISDNGGDTGGEDERQEEVSFTTVSRPQPLGSESEQDYDEGEVEDEESEEEDQESEDEAKAEEEEEPNVDDDNKNDSSIMVIDSDDDEDRVEEEEDQVDDEESEEEPAHEEEEIEEEEEEEEENEDVDDEEDYDEQTIGKALDNDDESSQPKPGPLSSKFKTSVTVSRVSRTDDEPKQNINQSQDKPNSHNDLQTRKENASGSTNNSASLNVNNAMENHDDIMKKVKFNQLMNRVRKQNALNLRKHSNEDGAEEWGSEDDWKDLKLWNEESHSKDKTRNQNSSYSNSCNESVIPDKMKNKINEPSSSTSITMNGDIRKQSKYDSELRKNNLESANLIPILNDDKGYFELGRCRENDDNVFLYSFSVTIIFAKELNQVVPGSLLRSCREGPYLSYSLLGCPVHTDPFKDIREPQYPAEKANARVLSSANDLNKYFSTHKDLVLSLMIGEIKLASVVIDISSVIDNSGKSSQVEGAYELIPVKGNPLSEGASESDKALVGVLVELSTSVQEKQTNSTELSNDNTQHSSENQKLEIPNVGTSKKRPRRNSLDSNKSLDTKNDSISLITARKELQKRLNPPSKRRKLSTDNEATDDVERKKAEFMEEVEEDLLNWRKAQENTFWKQWVVREKQLQESLTEEWKSKIEGLEEELMHRLEEVDVERSRLEDQWRRLREREERCDRREDQLVQLQEDIMEQQSNLNSQFKHSTSPPSRLAIDLNSSFPKSLGEGSSKQYYKSQWLRSIASSHRKWTSAERLNSSRLRAIDMPSEPMASTSGLSSSRHLPDASRGSSSRRRSSVGRYDDVSEEVLRLTKERRSLLSSRSPDEKKISELDQTINKLLESSGL